MFVDSRRGNVSALVLVFATRGKGKKPFLEENVSGSGFDAETGRVRCVVYKCLVVCQFGYREKDL